MITPKHTFTNIIILNRSKKQEDVTLCLIADWIGGRTCIPAALIVTDACKRFVLYLAPPLPYNYRCSDTLQFSRFRSTPRYLC